MLRNGFSHASFTLCHLTVDFIRLLGSFFRSRSALAAENLFLRKQLCLYQERRVCPHRATDATRLTMVLVAKLFDWRDALITVRPETFIGWHRRGFRMFWQWKSRRIGRPRIPKDLRGLILAMSRDNPTWGQARIANELLVKLGIQVSPRTVQKYLLKDPNGCRRLPDPSQRWMTFVHNHVRAMLACDLFIAVTVRFQVLYVFVIMEIGTRRLVHCNVTAHPNAAWTLQQFREVINDEQGYRFLIHDRDSIYSHELDLGVEAMGATVLKTPFGSPQANSYCERLIGGIRRECLDFVIPISEGHLRRTLNEWKTHYNQGRPHSSLGPGLPAAAQNSPAPIQKKRHQLQERYRVKSKAIFGGLHHEYWLEKIAA